MLALLKSAVKLGCLALLGSFARMSPPGPPAPESCPVWGGRASSEGLAGRQQGSGLVCKWEQMDIVGQEEGKLLLRDAFQTLNAL